MLQSIPHSAYSQVSGILQYGHLQTRIDHDSLSFSQPVDGAIIEDRGLKLEIQLEIWNDYSEDFSPVFTDNVDQSNYGCGLWIETEMEIFGINEFISTANWPPNCFYHIEGDPIAFHPGPNLFNFTYMNHNPLISGFTNETSTITVKAPSQTNQWFGSSFVSQFTTNETHLLNFTQSQKSSEFWENLRQNDTYTVSGDEILNVIHVKIIDFKLRMVEITNWQRWDLTGVAEIYNSTPNISKMFYYDDCEYNQIANLRMDFNFSSDYFIFTGYGESCFFVNEEIEYDPGITTQAISQRITGFNVDSNYLPRSDYIIYYHIGVNEKFQHRSTISSQNDENYTISTRFTDWLEAPDDYIRAPLVSTSQFQVSHPSSTVFDTTYMKSLISARTALVALIIVFLVLLPSVRLKEK